MFKHATQVSQDNFNFRVYLHIEIFFLLEQLLVDVVDEGGDGGGGALVPQDGHVVDAGQRLVVHWLPLLASPPGGSRFGRSLCFANYLVHPVRLLRLTVPSPSPVRMVEGSVPGNSPAAYTSRSVVATPAPCRQNTCQVQVQVNLFPNTKILERE